jgi:signal transduction histidine kinase
VGASDGTSSSDVRWTGGVPRVRTRASEAASETAFALLDALWRGPAGIAVFDRALRFLHVNDAISLATGTPPERHVGLSLRELLDGVDAASLDAIAAVEAAMRGVLETGRPRTNFIVRGALPRGRPRDWLSSFYPVVGPDGTVRGVCAMVSDATDDRERQAAIERERARAQAAADRLERLLALTSALSSAHTREEVLSVLVHQSNRSLGASSAVAFLVASGGLELAAARGAAAAASDPVAHRFQRLPLDEGLPVAEVVRTGEAIWIEDGATLAARFPRLAEYAPHAVAYGAMAALPLRVGAEVLGAVGFGFDAPRTFSPEERGLLLGAAEQSALALDRARLHEAEVRGRALLDAVLEAAPIGIAFLDRDQRYARVNRTLATMNGLPVEAHLGRTPGEVFPGLPVQQMEDAFREVMRTGKPLLDVEVEGETPSAPGKRRYAISSWYPVRTGVETLGVGVLVREVTHEREAEEFQRNVVSIVGHDLRNPLSALVISARLLLGAEDLPPARARLARLISSNAERMTRIVSVLHDYARVRGGQRIPLLRQRCDLREIVCGISEECEASRPGRTVRCQGEGDPYGEWDPDRLAQALANLVGNALDYSPAGSPVEVSWRGEPGAEGEPGEEVVVEVTNAGAPIPPEVLSRVFEPFRRGERVRPGGKDGLGLGLFIARAIVTTHGGRIEARSDPSRTTFTLHLPRSRAQRG